MKNRRTINLLPPYHQTDELKRLFAATVDHLFQPGQTDMVSGYIGRKPPYFDQGKDFYKTEPSTDRVERQLEPSVVSLADDGTVSRLMFYDDFVNHLRAAGAPTTEMSRLLASTRYSWAPPVDLDKLLNFQNYFWVDTINDPTIMTPPVVSYTADANAIIFALPSAIPTWGGAPDTVVVEVNGIRVVGFTVAAGNVILANPVSAGSTVKITRYADLVQTISGMTTAINPRDGASLSSGQIVRVIDGVRDQVLWIEGVGRSISFVSDMETFTGDRPYVVIDRTCKSRNVWSRRNRWVHRSVLSDAALKKENQATRPIVEFEAELVLYNYGTYRVPDISCTLSSAAIHVADADYPDRSIGIADINGLVVGTVKVDGGRVLRAGDRLLARQPITNWSSKTFYAANTVVYHLGNTYKAKSDHVSGAAFSSSQWTIDPLISVNNQIFLIEEVLDGNTSVYGLAIQTDTGVGAVTKLSGTNTEYWFDGNYWKVAQSFSAAPLFNVYDKNGISFSDRYVYPGSNFGGSKLFAFAQGSGPVDLVINQPLKYNEYGQIVFENDIDTIELRDDKGAIDAARFFAYDREDHLEYGNSWHINDRDVQLFDGSIPINLQANPDNLTPRFISRNQWFGHFSEILKNQDGFRGEPYSLNNWRDTPRDLGRGLSIVQHNGSLIRPMILASDDAFNIIDSIIHARNEYEMFISRFLRRFEDLMNSGAISPMASISSWVESVLTNLITTKQSDYAFALSSMAGGQFFIPPTASFLGILPPCKPSVVKENGIKYTQGHDGALRPLFNDDRDSILLELENRIYASIAEDFKSQDTGFRVSDFVSGFFTLPLDSQFTQDEFNAIIAPRFENWCQTRGLDYRNNETFSPEDPFTWNYSSIVDRSGRSFDGHWRGIYRYMFGTDRPHQAPWEMLGFADKPSWWENAYGPAPYTSGNLQMWQDIEAGRIIEGPREGISLVHKRSGLLPVYAGVSILSKGYLPVDESGGLLDPIAAHIVPFAPTVMDASKEWKFGDGAEIETSWIRSSGYRFDLCIALYLMRPVSFVERGWDTLDEISGPNGQPISRKTGKRPQMKDTIVHGERVDGQLIVSFGLQQWVSDYLVLQGKTPSYLGEVMRHTEVRLAHRVAGFTTFDNLSITTDNFGLIPQEDIQIVLHQAHSEREEFYSGVIVEWTGQGYRVYGFDPADCYFTVRIADKNARRTKLNNTDTNERAINPWNSSTYYTSGSLISYEGSVYGCVKSHTSSVKFETTYWEVQPNRALPDTGFLSIPSLTNHETKISYGTIFPTRQEVVDFLIGYGSYLTSRGWVFEADEEGTSDWTGSARAFSNWSSLNWEPGYFIALSPSARSVRFETTQGLVYNVEQNLNGFYGIYDRAGQPIAREISIVNRYEDQLFITAGEADIFGARVRVGSVEHALVLSNETIFDDVIYQPLYNLRQPRLYVKMLRSSDWRGRFDAPGYIIVNGEIKPSFDKSAENMRTMFDIENADDPTLRDYARHLIGFQKRDYLTALNLADTQQFEFYQGLIQNKGSVSAFNRLLRSSTIGQNRNLEFREEWGVRIGNYGARTPYDRWEVELKKDDINNENQFFTFDKNLTRDGWVNLQTEGGRWVSTPSGKTRYDLSFKAIANTPQDALPNAGYVRVGDVDFIASSMDDLAARMNEYFDSGNDLRANMTAWVHDTGAGEWVTLKARKLSITGDRNTVAEATPITIDGVDYTAVRFTSPSGLTQADTGRKIVFCDYVDTIAPISGVQTIVDVRDNLVIIDVDVFSGTTYAEDETGPEVCILEPTRFGSTAQRSSVSMKFWNIGDIVYVDDKGDGKWGVYRFDGNDFTIVRRQGDIIDNKTFIDTTLYNLGTKITSRTIAPNPLVLDRITVVDPMVGAIAGAADREISYKLEYDPAIYAGNGMWGADEVGQLWWDLSTVRFINPYTDDLTRADITEAEIITELNYRQNYWGTIAPSASVDVYEWVRSELIPEDWIAIAPGDASGVFAGEIYKNESAPFLAKEEYSTKFNEVRTFYYFWVKNRIMVPSIDSRKISAYACAEIIKNPSREGICWIAAISEKGMILGNVGEYLSQPNTILKMDFIENSYDGPTHQQWSLIRVGDEQSQPPKLVWKKIESSLVGFDDSLAALPDPSLHTSVSVGVMNDPRQNVFARRDNSVRKGIMDARKSTIDMINYILARHDFVASNRSDVNDLFIESPLYERLAWVQPDGSSYIEPLPPASEYDIVVNSIEERDAIFTSRSYTKFLSPQPWDNTGWEETPWDANFTVSPRILLNGLSHSRPFWSVWEVDVEAVGDNRTKEELVSLIDTALVPSKTFDFEVTSIAARDALPNIKSGNRVLIRDPNSNDFWTVWAFYEYATATRPAGFSLVNAQRFRTRDFIVRADWYAEGYDATHPPVVRYRTVAERNAAERDNPVSTFVRVDNDGQGNWMWSSYDRTENSWNTVARQNGTIQLVETLYDENRPIYGWNGIDGDAFDQSLVATRDGSFELRVILSALQDLKLLSMAEINELFFSIAHFIHSQQDQVDWLLPTSYMSVIGYKEPLRASAISTPDNIDTIMQYLDEVKPYRVKTRDFVRGLISEDDSIKITASDFDKPRYYDPALKVYRSLDPNNPLDADILRTGVWANWNANPSHDMVRKITTTVTYDRMWPTDEGIGSGSAYFINKYYQPTETMKQKDLATLLDLSFKGTVIDGRRSVDGEARIADVRIKGTKREQADVAINGSNDLKFGFTFKDAYLTANRPEELCVIKADDNLVLSIIDGWGAGVPRQHFVGLDTTQTTATSITAKLDFIPQSIDNIFATQDGVAIDTSLVELDHLTASIKIPVNKTDGSKAARIAVRALGYGATTSIIDQKFLISDGSARISMSIPTNARVAVEINGKSRDEIVTADANGITLNPAPTVGQQIVVTIIASGGSRYSANKTTLSYNTGKTWTVPLLESEDTLRHTAAIVELNGVRLSPPKTYYGSFGEKNRGISLDSLPNNATLEVWIDGVQDNSKTVLQDGVLRPISPSLMTNNVKVVARGDQQFDLVGTTLSVANMSSSDKLTITTFRNSSKMGIQTHVRDGVSTGEYFITASQDQNFVWVTVNGRQAMENIDYVVESIVDAYDMNPKDYTFFDSRDDRKKFNFFATHTSTDRVVITTFGNNVATPPVIRQLSTKKPSVERHNDGALNASAWEMNVLNSDQNGGVLAERLTSNSDTIKIKLNPANLPSVMVDSSPFTIPDTFTQKPGVIWISGERIEYFDLTVNNNIVTLGQLRRGTQNTFTSIFYSVGEPVYSANIQSSNFDRKI